jgi:CheY-like chemotaxis protein/Tfp pilus assembly protein PilZ
VEFDRPSGRVVAETEDLSAHGLYIRTEALLPVGEETEIAVELPNGTRLVLSGRVAHMLTPSAARALGRHPGMGFELTGPDTAARLQLRTHIDSLRTELTNPGLQATTEVLVIEPGSPLRTRIARCLDAAGFKVTPVASPTDAFEACTSWRPHAIVAASEMDAMSGVELAFAMAEHAMLSEVPLVLTGEDGDQQRLEAFRAGVRDFVPRPFLDEELVIRLHRVAAPPMPGNFGLRGSLADIGLPTLLSLFEFERKSGVLMVLCGADLARLFVAEGRIIKVEASTAGTARERLMRLLDWRDGQFEFSPVAVGGRDELGMSIQALLLEHARITDEAQAGR